MTPLAIATMVVVCGTVWGGFLYLLARAIRSEGAKRRRQDDVDTPRGPSPSP